MTRQGGKRSFAVNIPNRSSGHKFCVIVAIFVLLVAAASIITSQQQNEYSNLLNSSYLHNKNFVDHTSSNCKLSMSGTSGKCTTKDLEVAFALIGRDVAHELPYIFNNLMRLTPKFKRSHIIFVENDSGDGTVEAFWSWANSTQVKNVFQTANLISLSPGARGKKDLGVLAEARNAYLDYLKSEEFNSLDFMIPVDTDICHAWDVDTFAETIDALLPAFGTEWAVLYANGICDGGWRVDADAPHEDLVPLPYGQGMLPGNPACLPFYCDLFALRDHAGVQHSQHIINLIPGRCDLKNASTSFGCRELNGETVMPVRAAFGGMAMYWMGLFRGNEFTQNGQHCHYESTPGNPCEHVPLGLCLWEKGIKQLVAARWTVDWEGCTGPVQDTPQRIKCVLGNENVASSKT